MEALPCRPGGTEADSNVQVSILRQPLTQAAKYCEVFPQGQEARMRLRSMNFQLPWNRVLTLVLGLLLEVESELTDAASLLLPEPPKCLKQLIVIVVVLLENPEAVD